MLRSFVALCVAAVATVMMAAQVRAGEAETKAQAAADAWLAVVDAGQYGRSWDQASSMLKNAATRSGWEAAAKSVRASLGRLKGRKLKSATFTRTVPNAPQGEYVILLFDSKFENKADAVETVTPMKEADGSWKVAGYYIH
jgi:hypothetical protein